MSKGLDKILIAIGKDPGNLVLRDRYLMLVSEMPDSSEKAEKVLGMASLLKDIEPEHALRLAYFVHQYDRSYLPALELIASIFTDMARPGKAEVIRNHIETIKNTKDQTFQPLKTTFPKELHKEFKSEFNAEESIVASIEDLKKKLVASAADFAEEYSSYGRFDVNEASQVQQIPLPEASKSHSHLFTESAKKKVKNKLTKKPPKPPVPAQVGEFTPTFVLDDNVDPSLLVPRRSPIPLPQPQVAPTVAPRSATPRVDLREPKKSNPPPATSDEGGDILSNPEEVKGFIFDLEEDQKVVQRQPAQTVVPTVAKHESLSQPSYQTEVSLKSAAHFSPKVQVSAKPKAQLPQEHGHKIPEELFDYYWRQGFIEKAEKILLQSERFASNQFWWQERMLLIKSYLTEDKEAEFNELELEQEFRDWNIKIKKMLTQSKYRAALFEIYSAIELASNPTWVKLARNHLPVIWRNLGLRGFKLTSKTSLTELREGLRKRSMPTLSVIACGERF